MTNSPVPLRDQQADEHVHEWQNAGITKREQILYSPVSAMDHVKVIDDVLIRTCACGAIRKTVVARKERWLNR